MPEMRTSVAAFLDILGYKDLIEAAFKKGNGGEELVRLRSALDTAQEHLKHAIEKDQSDPGGQYCGALQHDSEMNRRLDFQLRSFTDNMVMGYPIPDRVGAPSILMQVIGYIGYFQMEMANAGYFVRGAISVGDLYIDDDIIFGPALMEAYRAEQSLAVYPRVILCGSAKEPLREAGSVFHPKVTDVLVDSDQRVFIDYLEQAVMIAYPDDRPFVEFLESHKGAIISKLKRYSAEPYVLAKYQWAAHYHNAFCEKYSALFEENYMIPSGLLASPPQDWIVFEAKHPSTD